MNASRPNLPSTSKLWLSQKIILALTLVLCLSATTAMGILYKYMNSELNYVSAILKLQKNYSEAFPCLLEMQLDQQQFIASKNPALYDHFSQLELKLAKINQNINSIINNTPELKECAGEFMAAINKEASIFKENMDIAKDFNISNSANLNEYIGKFNKIVTAFIAKENASLASHNKAIENIKNLFMLAGLIFIFSIIVFTYAICAHFANDIKILEITQNKLNELNAHLERKVFERTNDLENARLHAEKERQRVELLLQDTSHRIGNSLATVASLLGMQARRSNEEAVAQALGSARDRIQTIAAAHRRLRLGEDMETTKIDEFLQAVIHDIEYGMPQDLKKRINITYDLQPLYCASRDATTLGIVMGELLTNAIKYAFPFPNTGEIHVFFGRKEDQKLYLIIEDNGIGLEADSMNKQGLGLLVAKQLCMQFDCEPIYETSNGTKVAIILNSLKLCG